MLVLPTLDSKFFIKRPLSKWRWYRTRQCIDNAKDSPLLPSSLSWPRPEKQDHRTLERDGLSSGRELGPYRNIHFFSLSGSFKDKRHI